MQALSVNVSAASPFGDTGRRVRGMIAWAERVVAEQRPALVFAQECSSEWLGVWERAGYQVIRGSEHGGPVYKVESAIIALPELTLRAATVADVPTLNYHGSYVAAAFWPRPGDKVLLMSVHASPNRAESYVADNWRGDGIATPLPREGSAELWDSDAVLATLRHHAQIQPVIGVGDLNEALDWDKTHGGGSGLSYFNAVSAEGRLVSVLHTLRGGLEVATHRTAAGPGLQLDHVLASPALIEWFAEPALDPQWEQAESIEDWSDHAPMWFTLSPTR